MKMIPAILSSELKPNMRHGFTTLTQSQKMQSKQWKHPGSSPPKKFKRFHLAGMVMASIFWDSHGVIMINYLEQGRTINGAYYAGESRRLCQEIAKKRRGKQTRGALLLQDKAPAHTAQIAMTAATECGFEILPHPPYSPDMAPSDFYLFPKLNFHLRGTQYGSKIRRHRGSKRVLGRPEKGLLF